MCQDCYYEDMNRSSNSLYYSFVSIDINEPRIDPETMAPDCSNYSD